MWDLRGLQATLDADRFTLVVAPPPSFRCSKDKSERRVGTKSVPITSLTTMKPGKDNTFIVKDPKLRPTYRDRDDWMAVLEEVKAVYDRSFPEVAEGVAARERCVTVLFGKKMPAILCRLLLAAVATAPKVGSTPTLGPQP
eukprot:g9727.t1